VIADTKAVVATDVSLSPEEAVGAVTVPLNVAVPPTANVLPEPTFKPTDVPVPSALNTASRVSRSVFIFVPHVSVDAPTSGLVSDRFVVVESAMMNPY
jgi:hypothetical protein